MFLVAKRVPMKKNNKIVIIIIIIIIIIMMMMMMMMMMIIIIGHLAFCIRAKFLCQIHHLCSQVGKVINWLRSTNRDI